MSDCGRFKTGDKGQRYEVTFYSPDENRRRVFGWSDTTEGAQAMANSIEKHPVWDFPQVEDRYLRPGWPQERKTTP